jgi:hypothetical protein
VHKGDDQTQVQANSGENISKISLERIKELETTMRNRDLTHQELVLDFKGKINDLELENRTNLKNVTF